MGTAQGDVITEIGLCPISNAGGLARAPSELSHGRWVIMTFRRGQQKLHTEAAVWTLSGAR